MFSSSSRFWGDEQSLIFKYMTVSAKFGWTEGFVWVSVFLLMVALGSLIGGASVGYGCRPDKKSVEGHRYIASSIAVFAVGGLLNPHTSSDDVNVVANRMSLFSVSEVAFAGEGGDFKWVGKSSNKAVNSESAMNTVRFASPDGMESKFDLMLIKSNGGLLHSAELIGNSSVNVANIENGTYRVLLYGVNHQKYDFKIDIDGDSIVNIMIPKVQGRSYLDKVMSAFRKPVEIPFQVQHIQTNLIE